LFDPRSAFVRIVVDKVALGEVFLRVLRFHPLSIIPTALHIHLQLRVAVTRRTNGRSLGTFQKVKFVRKWGRIGYKNKLNFIFFVLKGLKVGEPSIFTNLSTRIRFFVLSRDTSNIHGYIISDNHN
jgi:hypothetical protein